MQDKNIVVKIIVKGDLIRFTHLDSLHLRKLLFRSKTILRSKLNPDKRFDTASV